MPSGIYKNSITGLSSTAGYAMYFPDWMVRPFSVSVACTVNSTVAAYTVEHSLDYTGSSTFISTAATWWPSSGITAAATNAFTAYNFPVTAIRLNSTAGSSTGVISITAVQAG